MTTLRQTQLVVEVLVKNPVKVRSTQEVVEALVKNTPALRTYQLAVEVLLVESSGSTYNLSLSIDGISTISRDSNFVSYPTLSIAGVSTIFISSIYNLSLSINGISSIAETLNTHYLQSITVAGISAFSSPGGVVYNIQRSIEGISSVSVLDGFAYTETLSIDGVAATAEDYVRLQNLALSIDGVAAFDATSQYGVRATLTIAGVSVCTITSQCDFIQTMSIAGSSKVYIENLYDFLLSVVSVGSFSASVLKLASGNENPAAVGTFSASAQCVFARHLTNSLTLSQTVVVKKPTGIFAQSLTFSHTATCRKIRVESVTSTITFTEDCYAAREVSETLSISDSADCIRVHSRSVAQTFSLQDNVSRNITVSRHLSDTLVFDTPNLQKLPIFGSQNQGANKQFEYYVPNVSVVLVPRKCLIILGVPSQTVILPCPIWGDSQAYQGQIDLKRSMTGLTYTYVKKVQTQKLHYAFELWTYKYYELRDFFIHHSEEVMMLQNHNAETWLVNLVNNPLEFTVEGRWQSKGEKYNVTLEFEGVKIA